MAALGGFRLSVKCFFRITLFLLLLRLLLRTALDRFLLSITRLPAPGLILLELAGIGLTRGFGVGNDAGLIIFQGSSPVVRQSRKLPTLIRLLGLLDKWLRGGLFVSIRNDRDFIPP